MANNRQRSSPLEVFIVFLRLGCISFGGPIAHLGYFRDAFVERRKWLTEASYAEVIALAQSMPGPASSQVGFAIGLLRAGWLGGLAAWTGFTLPSATLMLAFAYGYGHQPGRVAAAALHGLQLVAVAVVAQAVLRMQRTLAPDVARLAIALVGSVIALFAPPAYATASAIVAGAIAGLVLLRRQNPVTGGDPLPETTASETTISEATVSEATISRRGSAAAATAFVVLLVSALLLSRSHTIFIAILASLYRTGALVFGGGHVVLPLLDASIVERGWLAQPSFLAGYGAAQALPGPLFSIAAYVGAAARPNPHPLLLGLCSLLALFSPGLLLMAAVLPFWETLRRRLLVQSLLGGINASVVGVLAAALYRPLITTAVHGIADAAIACVAFVLLARFKVQPWIIVLGVTLASALVALH
jgi:chromate transporter